MEFSGQLEPCDGGGLGFEFKVFRASDALSSSSSEIPSFLGLVGLLVFFFFAARISARCASAAASSGSISDDWLSLTAVSVSLSTVAFRG